MPRVRPQQPMTEEECFDALGVDANADAEALKRAYRRQLRLNHPDLNGGNHERSEQLARAQQAYRALEQRRRGLGLHESTGGSGRRKQSNAAHSKGSPRLKPIMTRAAMRELWRRWALLPILSTSIIAALMWGRNQETEGYTAYHFLYIGAIGVALFIYFLGLLLMAIRSSNKG